ncbi:MAG: OB-fold nucleic acid binding domain-containing protein [Candidatus Thermoplasmatota archaeon]|nr:OB-fold nucleic acid binding domain-containing protein [Candidatus Thermoplasmatota archaeon]
MGRVVNLEVKDDTGNSGLVLWDKDVDLVANGFITKNTNLKIVNALVKRGLYGLEINIGRDSLVIIEPEDFPLELQKPELTKISELKFSKSVNISGKVVDKSEVKKFTRKDGSTGAIGIIKIADETGVARVIFWNERAKELERIKLGDQVEILDAYVKPRDGIEAHIGKQTLVKFVDL